MPGAEFFSLFGLYLRKNFFDQELCATLRAEIRAGEPAQATVRKTGSRYEVDPEIRSASIAGVSRATTWLAESRVLALKSELEQHYGFPLSGSQPLQFLQYQAGDFYRPHRDNSEDPRASQKARERRVSVIVLLNDESEQPREGFYGGGWLTFYGLVDGPREQSLGFRLAGEEGLLITFPSSLIHEVSPVTHGDRYSLVTWFF